jgi:hypothetical protein
VGLIRRVQGKLRAGNRRGLGWWIASGLLTLLSLAILTRLVAKNLDTLVLIRQTWSPWPLLLTFPVFCIGELVGSLAWGRIMNDVAPPRPLRQHAAVFMVTHAARRLPGSVWHIVGRIAWYERLGIRKGLTAFANVLENLLVLWSGLVLALLFIPFFYPEQRAQLPLLGGGVLLSALLMHPRLLRAVLRRLGETEGLEQITYRRVLAWLSFYLVLWLVGGTILFLALRGVYRVETSIWPLCVAAWCITGVLGTLILLIPSGLGLQEASLGLILSTQVPSAIAVAAALLMRILLTGFELLFAVLVFSFPGTRSMARDGFGDLSASPKPEPPRETPISRPDSD